MSSNSFKKKFFQFVTRAVRVIDLIANIDMSAFQAHQGLVSFINRLELEVNICRKEQPFEIKIPGTNESVPDDIETSSSSVSSIQNNTEEWKNSEENASSRPLDSNKSLAAEESLSSDENGEETRWDQSELLTPISSQKSRSTTEPESLNQPLVTDSQTAEQDVNKFLILRKKCIIFGKVSRIFKSYTLSQGKNG